MRGADEFEQVRSDPDPVRRAQRATELITRYQQRATELARLRKEAIEEAHGNGLSYTEIAELLGVTKGRISQIKSGAPPAERAFFGVGPVAVGIPRNSEDEDGHGTSDAAGRAAREHIEATLNRLSLASSRFAIEPDDEDVPTGDAVLICGPESAPVARHLLDADDALGFENVDGTWHIVEKESGRRIGSSTDSGNRTDIAFLGRREDQGRVIVHIAALTGAGSLGAAQWLDGNLDTLYEPGTQSTSAAIESEVGDDMSVTAGRAVAGPFTKPARNR
ncbi:sigma factor-like helix-turn-helix DNA-binding protein [Nocardia sp. NPDC024068]|uniref:sigma factor-like helix-turn-helix DNA-binding protein n=1 Tax=Nocardia sp. NPDC024068 TaxID=3157197 RepID=UPI003400A7C5